MSAQRFIDRVHAQGGRVVSFLSICGGLPAPASNTNPLGYKLSWSPRGVLLASRNTAIFLEGGEVKTVEGSALYEAGVGWKRDYVVDDSSRSHVGRLQLERYPNRDSTHYLPIYGIEEAATCIRGTYRNAGWCDMMKALAHFHFTDTDTTKADATWRKAATASAASSHSLAQFTYSVLTQSSDCIPAELASDEAKMRQWVGQRISSAFWSSYSAAEQAAVADNVLTRLQFLGLFSGTARLPTVGSAVAVPPALPVSSLDVMCGLFERHLQYGEGECDMCVMQHTVEVEWGVAAVQAGVASGVREQWKCVLVETGKVRGGAAGEYSSMARTVTLPVAACIRALLEGRWSGEELRGIEGVVRPTQPQVYSLVLDEMEGKEGIAFVERRERPTLWIRSEVKAGEHRTPVTPRHAQQLLDSALFHVIVERSPHRCIADAEYEQVGCQLVTEGSWQKEAPHSAIIIGLKELPDNDTTPLHHRHVFFAHCYKQQQGWDTVLTRFVKGKHIYQPPSAAGATTQHKHVKPVGQGLLYDLEYLTDAQGRRVAAFGRAAGVVGMALGILQWTSRQAGGKPLTLPLEPWASIQHMLDAVQAELQRVGKQPAVLVLGALGRCGAGCVWVCKQLGLTGLQEWDMAETKAGGPFPVLASTVDVLVNAIYLSPANPIPPFLTRKVLTEAEAAGQLKVSVVVDVSCDTSNPFHPLPFYVQGTTLFAPVLPVHVGHATVDVIAIDHLPALIPTEASQDFSEALSPHLPALARLHGKDAHPSAHIWNRAEALFWEKVNTLPSA
jgi:saccharopine dehydrogenase (NAD+, L-lysine-forming)